MWAPFTSRDVRVVLHYLGVLTVGMALCMTVPLLTALALGQWDPALDYLVGAGVAAALGAALMHSAVRPTGVERRQALLISGLAWLTASVVAAVPLFLSGNYLTYLDALFEALSGLTTSGLTLVNDLDHMAEAHNMWRHLTHLIGGQGIIVAALSLAIGLRGGAVSLYAAEARDERILPNVLHTARFIWFVTAVYVAVGTAVLFGANLWAGMAPVRSLLHGLWVTVACYDTGGFGPQSMNALYYHSAVFEVVTITLMLAGTLNFSLHAHVWRGDRGEILKNLETRALAFNIAALSMFAAIGLSASYFAGPLEAVRKGVYHIFSANTGTGHQTFYAAQWGNVGEVALVAAIIAMAFGGGASSTAGGIKALRVGLIFKSFIQGVKRSIAPDTAVVTTRYHHLGQRILTPQLVSNAMTVMVLYLVTYVTGALAGAAYGYRADLAMFESVSATANVGLSTGITSPMMPTGLKLIYMLQMWAGRLEFVAFFALIAGAVLAFKRQGRKASR